MRNTRYSGIQEDIEEYKIFRDTGRYRCIHGTEENTGYTEDTEDTGGL